jgi:AcrR family transcriptional regulator
MLTAMGNREALIAGAKRCLIEKGYARTTARDIAAASGVSLAAIGYHFGSKEALMNQAVFESVGDWADEVQQTLGDSANAATPLQRFEAITEKTLESFEGPGQGLWAAQLELMSLVQQNAELRDFIAGIQDLAQAGLAEFYLGIDAEQCPEEARTAGAILHALFIGIMVKWFLDPGRSLSAPELTEGMRIVAQAMASAGAA